MSTPKVFGRTGGNSITLGVPFNVFGSGSNEAMFNANITSYAGVELRVSLSLSTVSGSLAFSGRILNNVTIPPNGTLEVTGLAIGAGEYFTAEVEGSTGVSITAYGVQV